MKRICLVVLLVATGCQVTFTGINAAAAELGILATPTQVAVEVPSQMPTELIPIEVIPTEVAMGETVTPEATLTPLPPTPTMTPEPTRVEVIGLNVPYPYEFSNGVNSVDFSSGEVIEISDDFSGVVTEARATSWNLLPEGTAVKDALGHCGDEYLNLVAFNTQPGDGVEYSWEDTLVFAHSGRCNGEDSPFEPFRFWLEGGYGSADPEQRATRITEMPGKRITFGELTFEVIEVVYLSRDDLTAAYNEDIARFGAARFGAVDRFFSGDIVNLHELFIGFCASNDTLNPLEWFNAKYYILLRPVSADDLETQQ